MVDRFNWIHILKLTDQKKVAVIGESEGHRAQFSNEIGVDGYRDIERTTSQQLRCRIRLILDQLSGCLTGGIDHAFIDQVGVIHVVTDVFIPGRRQEVELNGGGDFLQKGNLAQVAKQSRVLGRGTDILRQRVERFAKGDPERDIAQRRLWERRLADLEHNLKIVFELDPRQENRVDFSGMDLFFQGSVHLLAPIDKLVLKRMAAQQDGEF